MSDLGAIVALDREPAAYQPEEAIAGGFRLPPDVAREAEAVELSVLWYTEGKGDEDLGTHFFERIEEERELAALDGPRRFSARLPDGPLSYDGVIVKVCWCVRVRVFCRGGEEHVGEAPFRLGEVAPAREVVP
jgi:hypothetical protein